MIYVVGYTIKFSGGKTIGKVSKKLKVSPNSSGFSTTNRSVWFDIRIKKETQKSECIKLHIIVDIDKGYVYYIFT